MPGLQKIDDFSRECNPIANVLVPLVARNGPVQLAPDADARGAKTITRFVVAGGKIDELPSLLASPFFPAKYLEARRWFFCAWSYSGR
jgi:hypothetical protein